MRTLTITALFLVLAAPVAFAQDDATGTVGLRDRVDGTMKTADETHALQFFAPNDSTLKVKMPKGRNKVEATLTLSIPGGGTIPVDGKVALPATGTYTLRVTGTSGLPGGYRANMKGKPAKKHVFTGLLLDGVERTLVFGALKGAKLNTTIQRADFLELKDPTGAVLRVAKNMVLPMDGEYSLKIAGRGADYKVTLNLKTPQQQRFWLYISRDGFGLAPWIDETDPAEGLVDNVLTDVAVKGLLFDATPEVELVKGKTVVPAQSVTFVSVELLRVDLDLRGLKTGKYDLVVRNPSGGEATIKFRVLNPNQLVLPSGLRDGSEVWYVEFDDGFEQSLDLFGLRGVDANVNVLALEAVEAYAVYLLRTHFGLDGRTGMPELDAVDVSFIIDQVSRSAGEIGEDYNRIVVSGDAVSMDSDNPNLNWGNVAVDTGNAQFDDVGGLPAQTYLPVGQMDPSNTTTTTGTFRDAFDIDRIGESDTKYFLKSFFPQTQEEIDRQMEIIRAVETLGMEIAAVAAHHVGRAMGLENNTTGLMSTPLRFGEFSGDRDISFTVLESTTLRAQTRLSNLPGKSKNLNANPWKLMPRDLYLLPEATTQVPYAFTFKTMGGRPDREDGDLRYRWIVGRITQAIPGVNNGFVGIPEGYAMDLGDGQIFGTAPFLAFGTFYLGAFQFQIEVTDRENSSDGYLMWHRLNLVINTANPAAPSDAAARNEAVRLTGLPGE